MLRWHRLAHICIVHSSEATSIPFDEWEKDVWFTRGWTLQDLLAPKRMKFYGKSWKELADMDNDKNHTERVADHKYLRPRSASFPAWDLIRERMSSASKRITTRTKDIASSFIGILNVNLPIAYREGTWALHRLMEVSGMMNPSLFGAKVGNHFLGCGYEQFPALHSGICLHSSQHITSFRPCGCFHVHGALMHCSLFHDDLTVCARR